MTILPNAEKAQGGMLKRGEVQQIFQMLRCGLRDPKRPNNSPSLDLCYLRSLELSSNFGIASEDLSGLLSLWERRLLYKSGVSLQKQLHMYLFHESRRLSTVRWA